MDAYPMRSKGGTGGGAMAGRVETCLQPVAGLVSEVRRVVDMELRARLLDVVRDVETDIVARLRICRGCGMVFVAAKRGGRAKRCNECRQVARHG